MSTSGDMPSASVPLVVQIKTFKAIIPLGLRYARNHLWLKKSETAGTRCGFTSFAVRQLGDIFRIDWRTEPGAAVQKGQTLGIVESAKAASELYAPASGTIRAFNAAAVSDPAAIGTDPCGVWLFEYAGDAEAAFSPEAYAEYLALATGGERLKP